MTSIEQEIINFQDKKDLNKGIKFIQIATDALFQIVQSLKDKNVKPNYHLKTLEGKYFRFGLTNHSYITLVKGTSYKLLDKQAYTPDIFSMISLTRMQIESYLVMHYLFFDKVPELEMDLRSDVYMMHGLRKQLNFRLEKPTEDNKKQVLKVESELNEVISHLKKNKLFINASESKRKKYLKPPNPKLIKTKDLHKNAGLTKLRMDDLWALYSNHVHAEYISDRQFNTIYKDRNSASLLNSVALQETFILMLTSKLIVNISKTFECTHSEYNKLGNDAKTIIETWESFL
ncbi:MAG: hypothetical protein PF448_12565 [Bacteroidales bacterium]|nr:hypothetical protein [Bacteroidales bacterium]